MRLLPRCAACSVFAALAVVAAAVVPSVSWADPGHRGSSRRSNAVAGHHNRIQTHRNHVMDGRGTRVPGIGQGRAPGLSAHDFGAGNLGQPSPNAYPPSREFIWQPYGPIPQSPAIPPDRFTPNRRDFPGNEHIDEGIRRALEQADPAAVRIDTSVVRWEDGGLLADVRVRGVVRNLGSAPFPHRYYVHGRVRLIRDGEVVAQQAFSHLDPGEEVAVEFVDRLGWGQERRYELDFVFRSGGGYTTSHPHDANPANNRTSRTIVWRRDR